MRPLNDRVAEAMRRERLGQIGPKWADWLPDQKEDWLGRADSLVELLRELGVFVAIKEAKRK